MIQQEYRQNSLDYWNNVHKEYNRETIKVDDWLERFDSIIDNSSKPILDLGCGGGNDTLYLITKGKKVISCDQSENAIKNIIKNFPEVKETRCFNMLDGIPFEAEDKDVGLQWLNDEAGKAKLVCEFL